MSSSLRSGFLLVAISTLPALTAWATARAISAQSQPSGAIPAPPDVAAPPADAAKTASGLATKILTPSTSKDRPVQGDLVTIHYTGWTTDGMMFDSSVTKGSPATFG